MWFLICCLSFPTNVEISGPSQIGWYFLQLVTVFFIKTHQTMQHNYLYFQHKNKQNYETSIISSLANSIYIIIHEYSCRIDLCHVKYHCTKDTLYGFQNRLCKTNQFNVIFKWLVSFLQSFRWVWSVLSYISQFLIFLIVFCILNSNTDCLCHIRLANLDEKTHQISLTIFQTSTNSLNMHSYAK